MSVTIAEKGVRQFVTQRGWWTPPFCDCMHAALTSLLFHAGYRLPIGRKEADRPRSFVWQLRQAHSRTACGTSIAHTQQALGKLLPDAPIYYANLTTTELRRLLEEGGMVRLIVNCRDIPRSFGQPAGTGNILHAVSIVGWRNGETFWMDPMGRPGQGYDGLWVRFADIPFRLSAGKIAVTFTLLSAAVPPPPPPPTEEDVDLVALFELIGFKGKLAASTPVSNPVDGKAVTNIAPTDAARVAFTADPTKLAVLVNTNRLPGPNPKVLHVEASRVEGAPDPAKPQKAVLADIARIAEEAAK